MSIDWKVAVPLVALVTLALGLAATACTRADPPDGLYGNGRIQGDEVRLASRIPGRLARVDVHEGDRVARDQVLAQLTTREVRARLDQARAGVAAARAAVTEAHVQVQVLAHHVETARADLARMQALLDAGAATAQQVDRADDTVTGLQGQLAVARARVTQTEAVLAERSAAVVSAETPLDDARVRSPLDGVVLLRLAEPGEVVQAGQPLLVLVDPTDLFLKVYIAEAQIGQVRIGDQARVTVDAFADRTFRGMVTEVAGRAEFTPRDVHMPDERTSLVFAVKIQLDNTDGFLKPGMLADARILAGQPNVRAASPQEDRGGLR